MTWKCITAALSFMAPCAFSCCTNYCSFQCMRYWPTQQHTAFDNLAAFLTERSKLYVCEGNVTRQWDDKFSESNCPAYGDINTHMAYLGPLQGWRVCVCVSAVCLPMCKTPHLFRAVHALHNGSRRVEIFANARGPGSKPENFMFLQCVFIIRSLWCKTVYVKSLLHCSGGNIFHLQSLSCSRLCRPYAKLSVLWILRVYEARQSQFLQNAAVCFRWVSDRTACSELHRLTFKQFTVLFCLIGERIFDAPCKSTMSKIRGDRWV